MQQGYSLIEVLVVVLIVGILTAVALPQYQAAVLKSRTAELLELVNGIKQAQEIYYTTYNRYSFTLENLDYAVDAQKQNETGSPIWYNLGSNRRIGLYSSGIVTAGVTGQISFTRYYGNTTYDRENIMLCDAVTKVADKVCKSLGGVLMHGNASDCGAAGVSGCRMYWIYL